MYAIDLETMKAWKIRKVRKLPCHYLYLWENDKQHWTCKYMWPTDRLHNALKESLTKTNKKIIDAYIADTRRVPF